MRIPAAKVTAYDRVVVTGTLLGICCADGMIGICMLPPVSASSTARGARWNCETNVRECPDRIGTASACRAGPRALGASVAYRFFEAFQPLRRLRQVQAKAR